MSVYEVWAVNAASLEPWLASLSRFVVGRLEDWGGWRHRAGQRAPFPVGRTRVINSVQFRALWAHLTSFGCAYCADAARRHSTTRNLTGQVAAT